MTTMATMTATTTRVLCCMCGDLIEPNAANTCSTCLASQSDITRGISTEATLHQCRGCSRWHKDAGKWIVCELESRELMGLCLSHISGLKASKHGTKVRLVDAGWIWTEPHSMRLKVRLTVQREVQTGTILQQSFTVNFIVRNQQCIECQAEFRQGSWKSLVQVRQRVSHKRTFLYLEQLILKHEAHRGCLKIEAFRDGMDFYFPDKGKAARFISFLETVTPIKLKTSKKLISADLKSNVANFKYTNYAEICPLCKDDLLYLPARMARNLGNISRLVLVKNISNVIRLIDPLTGQVGTMNPEVFWRDPVRPIIVAARSRMTRFVVLAKEAVFLRKNVSKRTPTTKQKSRLASLTLAREEDLGINDMQYEERSHVGYLMKAGDICVGYDLKDTNLSDEDAETIRTDGKFPDVIVIRKLYGVAAAADDEQQRAAKKRIWRLQRLDVKAGEEKEARDKKAADLDDMDEEDFMQEVEADKEMRLNMNLYKNETVVKAKRSPSMDTHDNQSQVAERATASAATNMDEEEENDDDDDDQKIQLDELLDALALDDKPDDDDQQRAVELEDDHLETGMMAMMYEEGQRAAKDGLKYISREDARNEKDKNTATVVTGNSLGKEFTTH